MECEFQSKDEKNSSQSTSYDSKHIIKEENYDDDNHGTEDILQYAITNVHKKFICNESEVFENFEASLIVHKRMKHDSLNTHIKETYMSRILQNDITAHTLKDEIHEMNAF